ncbi:NIN-like protein [Tanacetum coccineum]
MSQYQKLAVYEKEGLLFRADSSQSTIDNDGHKLTAENIHDPHSQKILRNKIGTALKLVRIREQKVLIQFWSSHVVGKDQVLTNIDQPYGLGDEALLSYRKNSECIVADNHLNPPGRVFKQRLPEWTSDLSNYLPEDFPQQECAIHCNLHGYLALPVFHKTTEGLCIGVLELLGSYKYTSFAYEVIQVHAALKVSILPLKFDNAYHSYCFTQSCTALSFSLFCEFGQFANFPMQKEAKGSEQNLTCQQAFDHPALNVPDDSKQNEWDQIHRILIRLRDIHNIPLAQTWEAVSPSTNVVSHQKVIQKCCSSFDTECIGKVCMSTASQALCFKDPVMVDFIKKCNEVHLENSKGVVGRALSSKGLWYCRDVTKLNKEEYPPPLAIHAQTYELTGCFAIFLHSVESNDDYVLEFFLRSGMEDDRLTIKDVVQTLKGVMVEASAGLELGDTSSIQEEQGGLGIKNLQVWNEVLLVKQLWNVISKKNTLWVKWVNTEILRDKSVWVVDASANSSVGWKEMLKLRDKIRKYVLWKIGDGQKINTWYDTWNAISPLCEIITSREIYEVGLNIETNIVDLVMSYGGNWPDGWTNEYPILSQYGILSIQDGRIDAIVWVDKNGEEKPFSVKNVWKDMECDEAKADWCKVVWFNRNIPRHALVLWMALQNRLNTQDRIAVWKPNDVMHCVFCNQCLDSIEHLFFKCKYSKNVWKELQRLLNVNISFSWRNSVEELQRLPNNNNIWSIVRRLMFGVVVYYIWQERNNRIFREGKRDEKILVQTIKEIIQLKIVGFEVKDSKAVREVEARWNVKIQRKRIDCK